MKRCLAELCAFKLLIQPPEGAQPDAPARPYYSPPVVLAGATQSLESSLDRTFVLEFLPRAVTGSTVTFLARVVQGVAATVTVVRVLCERSLNFLIPFFRLQTSLYKSHLVLRRPARCSVSSFIISTCSHNEASVSGVLPSSSFSSMLAPYQSSRRVTPSDP